MQEMITSVGGPHLLIEKNNLKNWGGIRNAGGRLSHDNALQPDGSGSDYERACKIAGYISVIPVGSGSAISFWGDRFDIGLKSLSPTKILIVRIATDFEEPFQVAEALLESVTNYEDDGNIEISCEDVYIIDATEFGGELTRPNIHCLMKPGVYKIRTRVYETDDQELMVLHLLSLGS